MQLHKWLKLHTWDAICTKKKKGMKIFLVEKKTNYVVSMQLRTEVQSCCSGSQVVLWLDGLHNCLLPLQNCLK